MNLDSLFPKQKELDNHIIKEKGLQGQDLLKKKTVALICELYEMTNEGRWFKFWSDDQKPRVEYKRICHVCKGKGGFLIGSSLVKSINNENQIEECLYCDGVGYEEWINPLLEEYADTIHFTLSIANDLGYHEHKYIHTEGTDLNDLVLGITSIATIIPQSRETHHISTLINNVIQLGYQLGFTEEDVLNAYDSKNEVNYSRQQNGY